MKAIRVEQPGGPEVMKLVEVQAPEPQAGQVRVKIEAAGVNPIDTYVRAGLFGTGVAVPYTPGSDGAGTVEAVGPGAGRFEVGDRVFLCAAITGTYAEKALCVEAEVHPLPERLSFEQGAAVGIPYGTAWRALFHKARVQPGETLLVHGASGGVGLAAVQLAVAHGVRVIGTAGSEAGRKLVLEQGAAHVLDHGREGYLDELLELTDGHGPQAIVEMLANRNLGHDLRVLAPRGRVVVVGSRGPVQLDPRDLMNRDGEVLAMRLPNATAEERASVYAAVGAALKVGSARPVVGARFALADAPAAHHRQSEGKAGGKIVLIP